VSVTPHPAPKPFTLTSSSSSSGSRKFLFRKVLDGRGGVRQCVAVKGTAAWPHRADAYHQHRRLHWLSIALIGGQVGTRQTTWAAIVQRASSAKTAGASSSPRSMKYGYRAPTRTGGGHPTRSAVTSRRRRADKCCIRKMGLEFYVDLQWGRGHHQRRTAMTSPHA